MRVFTVFALASSPIRGPATVRCVCMRYDFVPVTCPFQLALLNDSVMLQTHVEVHYLSIYRLTSKKARVRAVQRWDVLSKRKKK